ncbi:MAG: MBL fold metallo-hydrolase [Candidatus Atabeyarchaeum deiterrae]
MTAKSPLTKDQKESEQIAPNIFLVHGKNNGRFPYSNSVLVAGNEGKFTLVDTGCGIDVLRTIKEKFNVNCIINSHTHPDHSAGNWLFRDSVSAIYVPREGYDTSGNIVALSERLAEPGFLAEYWRDFVAKVMDFRNCRPTDMYDEKKSFEFGTVALLPIHTPGHTLDHYCLYEPNQRILFSFDYDLSPFGPWYGHRESSIPLFKNSIEKLRKLDIRILVPGHGNVIETDIRDQLSAFSSKFDERDTRVLSLLEPKGKTIDQLVEMAPIYGKYPYAEPLLRYWEGKMIEKHLEGLISKEKVIRKEKYFCPKGPKVATK